MAAVILNCFLLPKTMTLQAASHGSIRYWVAAMIADHALVPDIETVRKAVVKGT